MKYLFAIFALLLFSITGTGQTDIKPNSVVPSQKQLNYQSMEMVGFIHFTVNTFTDKEWGYGDESPAVFDPKKLDAEQWVKAAKDGRDQRADFDRQAPRRVLSLAKRLYRNIPSKTALTKTGKVISSKNSPRHVPNTGSKPDCTFHPGTGTMQVMAPRPTITYYKNQLRELLTNYGKISEVWFDGANGGDGYYGGARETRKIDKLNYYPWKEIHEIIHQLQPDALIFSDAGPDLHWIGNERGIAGETFWSMFNRNMVTVGDGDTDYLNRGDYFGNDWVIGQCDVSIRKGWFYHSSDDESVKTPSQLVDLWYKSVGRNAVFLLNIPPNQDGLFAAKDVANLKKFREILDNTFKENIASNAKALATSVLNKSEQFCACNLTDGDPNSYWAADNKKRETSLEIEIDSTKKFDRILLQEPVRFGQRISSFDIELLQPAGWQTIASGTSIGYKKILRITAIAGSKIRINIREANNIPALSNFGLYKAASGDVTN